jgi:hypothetical protein
MDMFSSMCCPSLADASGAVRLRCLLQPLHLGEPRPLGCPKSDRTATPQIPTGQAKASSTLAGRQRGSLTTTLAQQGVFY